MKRIQRWVVLLAVIALAVFTAVIVQADDDHGLSVPEFTETDCVWDENGRLISETARSLDGSPALNSRGFAQARYTWDERGNLLKEAFFGLNGEPVIADGGYAWAEYTYGQQSNGKSYVLTEDRYAADGGRAQIPGSYSFRRDAWEGDQILSSEYYDAAGALTQPTGGYAQKERIRFRRRSAAGGYRTTGRGGMKR